MEKMTKANFWNVLEAEYPEQTADFRRWLSEYARREGIDRLFDAQHSADGGQIRQTVTLIPVGFHDLPNAMQIGIFIQYTVETGAHPFHCEDELTMEYWQIAIGQWFSREKENCGK